MLAREPALEGRLIDGWVRVSEAHNRYGVHVHGQRILGEFTQWAQLQDGYRARCEQWRVLRSVVDMFRLAGSSRSGVDRAVGPSALW